MSWKSIVVGSLLVVLLAGCSHSLSGVYLPQGGGMGNGLVMQKLEFLSSTEVNLYMMEQVIRANYKIDGNQVLFVVNGQQLVFTLDGACLDGGKLYGKFCKG